MIQFFEIFYTIVLPVLLVIGVGYLIQRRFNLDLNTLKILNFYFTMPAMILYAVISSELSAGDVGTIIGFKLAFLAVVGGVAFAACRLRKVPVDQRNTVILSAMLPNSGNFGLPLQDLAFRNAGLSAEAQAIQAIFMLTQNFFTFSGGLMLAGSGRQKQSLMVGIRNMLRFPPVYTLTLGLIVRLAMTFPGEWQQAVGFAVSPVWEAIVRVRVLFIGLALFTLGAQLAKITRSQDAHQFRLMVFMRLLMGPAIGVGLLLLFGIQGFIAQVLLISTSSPIAVNVMLLAMEFDNRPDLAAQAVFWTTVLAPVTVTLTIMLSRSGLF